MATTLSGIRLETTFRATATKDGDLADAIYTIDDVTSPTVSTGTANSQCDLEWDDERTLTASQAETLDLAGGLTDIYGATLTFAKIRAIKIYNKSTVSGANLKIGGASSSAWFPMFANASDILIVPPKSDFFITAMVDGFTVTASSADNLKLQNADASNSLTYKIMILGVSA